MITFDVTEKNNKGYGSVLYTEKIINNNLKKSTRIIFRKKRDRYSFSTFLNIQKNILLIQFYLM